MAKEGQGVVSDAVCPLCLQDVNCTSDTRLIDFAYYLQQKGCKIAPMRVRILFTLALRAPKPVMDEYLKDVLWGTDLDGGPMDSDNTIKVHCSHINRMLRESELDWKIVCINKFGHRLEGDVTEALEAL